jgi:hypothetical protein
MESWRKNGVATLILEIPGTGDCPADPSDPLSPDRLYSSLFDWIGEQQVIAVWGFSTGGYYAIRVAHTHHEKLAGVVSQGGGCHYMFDPKWLDEVNHLEYPFDLADTLAYKFGYSSLSNFKAEALSKYSLVNDGTLDRKQCARLLLVNGTGDEIFPVDDCYVATEHGMSKEMRIVRGAKHMGEPEAFFIILGWLYKLLGVQANPVDQVKTLPFKAKFKAPWEKEIEVGSKEQIKALKEGMKGGPEGHASGEKNVSFELGANEQTSGT